MAVALDRTGSVARAAEELHLTPSAVSQQLDRLDAEARVRLTERDGRGLRLTPAGRLLAEHAAELLARMQGPHTTAITGWGSAAASVMMRAWWRPAGGRSSSWRMAARRPADPSAC